MTLLNLSTTSRKITFSIVLFLGFLYVIVLPHFATYYCTKQTTAVMKDKEKQQLIIAGGGEESFVARLTMMNEYYYTQCLRSTFGMNK